MILYVTVDEVKKFMNHNEEEVHFLFDNRSFHIDLLKQKTGYGEKLFMKCPICGSRRVDLFLNKDKLMCRNCYPKNIYAGIQNHLVGGTKYLGYRMRQYALKHNIEIIEFPFRYFDYDKPRNRKEQSWVDNITVLQALENMRTQAHCYNKSWNSQTVNSVLTWNNSMMYINDLGDMVDFMIEWDKGVDMSTEFMKQEGACRK